MTQDAQIAIRISEQLLEALDNIRRKELDLPSRAEMIRRLIVDRSDHDHLARSYRSVIGIPE